MPRRFEPCLFDFAPQQVSEWGLKKTAAEAGISVQSAIKMKIRFAVMAAEIWAETFQPYYWRWVDVIIKLRDIERRIQQPVNKNELTDSMIEQAREVPITSVVDFNKGKATAWCHADKNPSLTHMTRTNTAWCASCGIYFDPIKVLMTRDGMTFPTAVRYLCN